jgi:putative addiction module antidote
MQPVKVIQIGESLAIVLPTEIVGRLGLESGQHLRIAETETGFALSRHDPEFDRQMRAAERIMDRYHETLRLLAK